MFRVGKVSSVAFVIATTSVFGSGAFALGCSGSTSGPPAPPLTTAVPTPVDASAAPLATEPDAGIKGEGAMNDGTNGSSADAEADATAANTFTFKLWSKAASKPGNALLSGTSVRRALSAALLGAKGDTAKELATTLELPDDLGKVASLGKAETAAWQAAKGKGETAAAFIVADRVWTDQGFALKPDYTKLVTDALGASAEAVDFAHAPDAARTTINGWVSEKTAKKVPELLPGGSVDKRTRVVITDAIYFKAKWALPFTKGATKDEAFTGLGGKKITTPMMHATESHRFADAGNVKLLEMRYDGSDLAMLVVLPKEAAGLAKVESKLDAATLDGWVKGLAAGRVAVTLPKFTFPWGGSVKTALGAMGIKNAFTPAANFEGMAEPKADGKLEISDVVHKTWVAVDENGTEAAAATGVVMRTTSMPIGEVAEFKADHPFLFLLRDTKTGRVLFVGRVADPKASGT